MLEPSQSPALPRAATSRQVHLKQEHSHATRRNDESKALNWSKSIRKRERLAKRRDRRKIVEDRLRALGEALADMDPETWPPEASDFPELAALAARLQSGDVHLDAEIEDELARWFPTLAADKSLGVNWLELEAAQMVSDLKLAGIGEAP
jgi:hypothetical protein